MKKIFAVMLLGLMAFLGGAALLEQRAEAGYVFWCKEHNVNHVEGQPMSYWCPRHNVHHNTDQCM